MTPKIENSSDANAAIESLEALLKSKIRLQDAQTEAQPVLEAVGLLFEPNSLDEDQKNLLRNGLKSLKKLLEAHTAYGEALQQAEPARAIVSQLLGAQPESASRNGKAETTKAETTKAETTKPETAKAESTKPETAKAADQPAASPEKASAKK